jgi:hypothetical protein
MEILMRRIPVLALWLLVPAAGCNDALSGGGDGPGGADLTMSSPDLTQGPDLVTPPASGIGDACTGNGQDQGSCSDPNQICITDGDGYPGGYCSEDCSSSMCPSDASCVMLPGLGFSLCFKNCTTSADCRQPDYHCSMRSHTCQPNNFGGGNGGGVTPGTADGGACVTPVVNPGQGLTGPFGANTQASTGMLEAECWLGVDTTGMNVLVGYNDLASNGPLGSAASSNGGMTWGANKAVPPDTTVDKNQLASDPVVAIDSLGHFWASWVGYDPGGGMNVSNMHVWAARSSDNGATYDQVVQVSPAGEWVAGGFIDKPWMDIAPDDTMYLTWSRANAAQTVDIRIARSTDHGMTWTAQTVSDTAARPNLDRNLAQSAIDATGRVVTTWVEIEQEQFGATSNGIFTQAFKPDFSKDGTNVKVTKGTDSPAFEDPSIAVDGMNVYVGFISGTPAGDWDVRVSTSLDGAATYGPSVKVNDDRTCATHFHHQIAVDGKGNLHAIWYDNRFLTGNVFYAMSAPADAMNPLAFGKNVFVNDQAFSFTTRRDMSNWLGDYLGLIATPTGLYAAWSDNRLNNFSHIFFAKAPAL